MPALAGHKYLLQNCIIFEAGIQEVSSALKEEPPITIADDQRGDGKKNQLILFQKKNVDKYPTQKLTQVLQTYLRLMREWLSSQKQWELEGESSR